ncbi:hypothetical protein HY492_04165 [Candidatus Woesearchaeota archaeon]|nr:hypothetical protein [Candidatus Woesearchaeota archaeon]
MDKCIKHTKELVGGCMWCGKRLCEFCIARKEGLKVYCEKCAQQLGPPRRSIPVVETKPVAPVIPERRSAPRIDKDGYFDFSTVRP